MVWCLVPDAEKERAMKTIHVALFAFVLGACSSSSSSPTGGSAGGGAGAGASGGAAGSGGGAETGGTGSTSGTGGSAGSGGTFVPPACDPPDAASGFHATIDGTPQGDGSLASPWDLDTALNAPPGVEPGDTVWIHEGTYKGTFVLKHDGEDGAPVMIRAWPGDRVTLDGDGAADEPVLQLYHQWMVVRDLEITNSNEDRRSARTTGIYVGADHVKLVNESDSARRGRGSERGAAGRQ